MTTSAVRKAFYSLVCFTTLGLSAWGAFTILSVVLRSTLFLEADRYYSRDESDATAVKNARVERQRDFVWALPILIINLPMFFVFYPEVKRKDDTVARDILNLPIGSKVTVRTLSED